MKLKIKVENPNPDKNWEYDTKCRRCGKLQYWVFGPRERIPKPKFYMAMDLITLCSTHWHYSHYGIQTSTSVRYRAVPFWEPSRFGTIGHFVFIFKPLSLIIISINQA